MLSLVAHQGGWDELMWFSVPIVAVALWVRWAERRARARTVSRAEAEEPGANMPGESDS
jgi:hypothetical protein